MDTTEFEQAIKRYRATKRPGQIGMHANVEQAIRMVVLCKSTWAHAAKTNGCTESAISYGLKKIGIRCTSNGFSVAQ